MQLYNDKKKRIGTIANFRNREISTVLGTGDKELIFEYPESGKFAEDLKEEYYIRTKTDEFVIKSVEKSEEYSKYTAVLNVEELEGTIFAYGFASEEQTIRACLEFALEDTEWTIGDCEVTKKRTIDEQESVTAWDILQKCLSTYRCECTINSIDKRIDIYERIGSDKGCYFVEGLNLRKLTLKSDTYDFYTRIYPIGKDGITPEWLIGKDYIDNFQYSTKVKGYVWKDERYTNTTSLIEDATAKLEEMSRPYKAYTANVIDLAKVSEEYKDILSYKIGDTVTMVSKKTKTKEKQRIVKIIEHPEEPEKNTIEISNARKTFAQLQQEETESAKEEAISIANSTTKKILGDYDTTKEVESKITASEENIELSVKETLKSYATTDALSDYATTKEVESKITASKENIELSVKETLKSYATTDALSDYTTTETVTEAISKINITTDEITAEVNKKVNGTEFGTLITQNAENVRIAWNGNSKYIQFENGAIVTYDGATANDKKRAKYDQNGSHFYRDGYYVGKIGTNQWSGDNTHKGLVFDLDYEGKYMAFAQKASASASTYTTMLCFSREGSIYGTYGMHLGCDIDMHNFKLKNVTWENPGITAKIEYVQIKTMNSDGTAATWGPEGMMRFENGILTEIKYY